MGRCWSGRARSRAWSSATGSRETRPESFSFDSVGVTIRYQSGGNPQIVRVPFERERIRKDHAPSNASA
jgi:hypothetical protein